MRMRSGKDWEIKVSDAGLREPGHMKFDTGVERHSIQMFVTTMVLPSYPQTRNSEMS